MNAVALTSLRRMGTVTLPMPTLPQDDDVLLKMECIGVCGSDVHYFVDGRIGPRAVEFPFVVGHEGSAVVQEVGRAVRRVRPGDRVAIDPAVSCHQCDQCRQGRENTCRRLAFLGCPGELPGCLCEFITMPESCLYPVRPDLTAEQAALCEPLSIGVYAVRQSQLSVGGAVAILGAGPIGLCVLAAAREHGAGPVYMTDLVPERVALARKAGAAWSGHPEREDVVRAILNRSPGGLDVVYECAGQQSTLDQAVDLLKPGGRLMLVGIPREERVSFAIDMLRRKEITLINVRRQNRCVQAAIDLLTANPTALDFLVTHHFTPDQAQQAFDLVANYQNGVLKAMIHFNPIGDGD